MIIASAPLRISFAGGGSDLPVFSDRERGAVVSAAISLYVHITLTRRPFETTTRVAGRNMSQEVENINYLEHDLARECLQVYGPGYPIEINSVADAPAGSGLGSSSAYTVALLAALGAHRKNRWDLAEHAFQIEAVTCGRAIGRQDAYASAVGGINRFEFRPNASGGLPLPPWSIRWENLLLLYTGEVHDASDVHRQIQTDQRAAHEAYRKAAVQADKLFDSLHNGDGYAVGPVLNASWELKRSLPGVTTPTLDRIYRTILEVAQAPWAGAKLCGAGAGGCFLIFAPPERHELIAEATGLLHIHIELDARGVTTYEIRRGKIRTTWAESHGPYYQTTEIGPTPVGEPPFFL